MSVRVSSLVWKLDAPAGEKIVLLKMADFANELGDSIYPSCAAVARDCCCSERHVQRVWSKYREMGILVCENTSGGRGKTTRYSFDMARLKGDTQSRFMEDERATHSQGLGNVKGDTQTVNTCRPFDKRVTSTTLKGDTQSQKGDNGDIPPTPPFKGEPSLTVINRHREGVLGEGVSLVVGHFNRVTGRSLTVEGQRKHIEPRLKKNSVEELCLVIDHKFFKWGGTDRAEYVRPETLFRPGHWDEYLDAAKAWDKGGRSGKESVVDKAKRRMQMAQEAI